ncbi:MAG: PIN domain protein [Gammaproteobacteria bacterium]|nr:MAG: PIN domain protein [Gammaproteobacteria bacterium]
MTLYLDNCVFNRPFDDQKQIRIKIESLAKLYIQDKIKKSGYKLIWSDILEFENDNNPHKERTQAIEKWKNIATIYVPLTADIQDYANDITKYGIKPKDALHVASSISTNADYFITTDDGLLKKINKSGKIIALNPIDFLQVIQNDSEHN